MRVVSQLGSLSQDITSDFNKTREKSSNCNVKRFESMAWKHTLLRATKYKFAAIGLRRYVGG